MCNFKYYTVQYKNKMCKYKGNNVQHENVHLEVLSTLNLDIYVDIVCNFYFISIENMNAFCGFKLQLYLVGQKWKSINYR